MVGLDEMRIEDRQAPVMALWTSRLAFFCVALLLMTLFLHRVFSMPTGVMLNLVKLSMLGAVVVLVMGILATIDIWRRGTLGASRVVVGAILALAILSWPLVQLPKLLRLPEINDVTTDTANPPQFVKLAEMRPADANRVAYPGEAFAKSQRKAYPDLKTVLVNRSAKETFEIAAEALRRQRMVIVNQQVPTDDGTGAGLLEAYDRTLILGFYDDISVRIRGNDSASRLDVRSASRYGRHDLGSNAERIRRFLTEFVNRLEATVPSRDP